jgi:hypothetical protein
MKSAVCEPVDTLPTVTTDDGERHVRVSRKRRVLLVCALVVLAAAGVTAVALRSSDDATYGAGEGPVTSGGGRTMTGIKAEVGQEVTFGGVVLFNSGQHPAIVERVSVEPPVKSGLVSVGIKAAGKDRKTGFVGADAGFPPQLIPPAALASVEGAVVPARSADPEGWGLELVFGFKVNQPGQYGFRHVVVDYSVGGKHHRVRLDDGFVVCAPVKDFPSGCSSDHPT